MVPYNPQFTLANSPYRNVNQFFWIEQMRRLDPSKYIISIFPRYASSK